MGPGPRAHTGSVVSVAHSVAAATTSGGGNGRGGATHRPASSCVGLLLGLVLADFAVHKKGTVRMSCVCMRVCVEGGEEEERCVRGAVAGHTTHSSSRAKRSAKWSLPPNGVEPHHTTRTSHIRRYHTG
jgi:hypothetical protein